jgi:isopentenyl phosphate kinase
MSSRACRCPKCQSPRLATRSPGPLVQASCPSFTPSVHRHGTSSLTFTSPSAIVSVLHTYTTQAKRHVVHKTFAKVGLVTAQPTSWITLTITHHKTNTQGYLSTLCSQFVPVTYGALKTEFSSVKKLLKML